MNGMANNNDDSVECPLCMEPLEVDDLTFFPCTCGYQVSVFLGVSVSRQSANVLLIHRFADSAGTEFGQTKISCVQHVVKNIPKIQPTLNLCLKKR